jgi:hypothetical protein
MENNFIVPPLVARNFLTYEESCPVTPCRRNGGEEYSSYSFLTSAVDGVSGRCHSPAALYPCEKDPPYPLDSRLSGPQSWSAHRG